MSRSGPLGSWGLLFTPQAMIVAQTVLIAPIIAALARQTVEDLWNEYRDELAAMDVGPLGRIATLIWDGRFSLVTALLAGFGHAAAAHHGADPAHARACDLGRPGACSVHASRHRIPAAGDAAPQRRGQYPLCARRRRRAARAARRPRPRARRARRPYRARAPASTQALRRRATAACARTRARQGTANPPAR